MRTMHSDRLLPQALSARAARWITLLTISLLLHFLLLTAADRGIGRQVPAPASDHVVEVAFASAIESSPASAGLSVDPRIGASPARATMVEPRHDTKKKTMPRYRSRPKSPVATTPEVTANAVAIVSGPDAGAGNPTPTTPDMQATADAHDQADDAAGVTQDATATAGSGMSDTGSVASTPTGTAPETNDIAGSQATPAARDLAPPANGAGAGASASKATPSTTAEGGARHYKIDLPPSARLAYEIRYSTRGNITHGSSVIDWQAGNATYAVHGEVTKFGISLSSFRSEGAVDADGIEPALYAEKNLRRSETNTHFQRDARRTISFSASTDAYPLITGAQDRASILWQLAGIARGDGAVLIPGTTLDVFVAGVRDADHWLIEVVGEETVSLEHGETRAWHLVRAPRPGTYDKRIDIWLAPAQQWYPVKLRYTEKSGDYLDLSLAEVR